MTEIDWTAWIQNDDRQVAIEVTGSLRTAKKRWGTYILTVPYSRLSQTIQRLHQMGGRIVGLTVDSGPLMGAKTAAASLPQSVTTVSSPTATKGRLHRRSGSRKSRLAKTSRQMGRKQRRRHSKSYCLG